MEVWCATAFDVDLDLCLLSLNLSGITVVAIVTNKLVVKTSQHLFYQVCKVHDIVCFGD